MHRHNTPLSHLVEIFLAGDAPAGCAKMLSSNSKSSACLHIGPVANTCVHVVFTLCIYVYIYIFVYTYTYRYVHIYIYIYVYI